MGAARLGRTDRARADVVDGVDGSTVAVVVLIRRAVAGSGEDGADALPKGAIDAGLRPSLADATFSIWPAGPRLAFDARAAAVVDAVAVRIVSCDGARISLAGTDGSLAR